MAAVLKTEVLEWAPWVRILHLPPIHLPSGTWLNNRISGVVSLLALTDWTAGKKPHFAR